MTDHTTAEGVDHKPTMDGYFSQRCRTQLGGCRDNACVCQCHVLASYEGALNAGRLSRR